MADAINAALQRICSSETFRLAHQQREFLSFLIHRLGGNSSDGFKESLLGMEFFGRKPGYDPKADPIVRVEAHRLRRRLETYYRKEGAGDPQRIELGKGSYLPILVAPLPRSAQEVHLAVLVKAEDELTSIGMTAELVRNLGKLKNLRVLAPQSILATDGDAGKAVSDLGASVVLQCNITGGNFSAVLKRVVPDGFELIGSFDNQIQSTAEIVKMFVASALQVEGGGPAPRVAVQECDRETYQIYLSGRAWFLRWSPDNLMRAKEHFREVLKRYPIYAPAFAGLADCEVLESYWFAQDTRRSLEDGYAWATKALELDPGCSEAYCSLAAFQIALKHDWEAAETNFRKAIRLNPSYSLGLNWLSIICLVPLGRFDEAIDAVFEAYDLDPVSPEIGNEIVWVRINCRQFAESAEQGQRMIAQHRDFLEAYWSLGLTESALGHHEAARRAFQIAEDLDPTVPHTIAWRGYVEGCAGNRHVAERYLARLDEIRSKSPVRSIHYCWLFSGIGELDKAIGHFEDAIAEADPFTLYADVFFPYFNLRQHPRFRQIRQALRLPDSNA